MPRILTHVGRWVAAAGMLLVLAVPTGLLAQMPTPGAPVTMPPSAVPKFPTQLPTPGGSQAPAAAQAPSAQPAPSPAPAGKAAPRPEGRDPFEPLVTKAPEGESRPSLSGVRLVGVVWDPVRRDQIRALVETPDGLGYYVRVNEEKFGGKVVAIERDRIRFSVREQDPSGQGRVRTVELKLSQ
jgi:Tfp pilus assembly protein PilP